MGLLLEAFARVRREAGPGTALVLVGDGPEAEAMRARAPEGVHFTGFLRGTKLAEAYASADLFVFPSDTETFGNVVLEGLASGLPAVVVDRGGVRDTVIPGRTGMRVPVGDATAFANACIRLIRDDDERDRLARGARAEALSRSWPAVLDGLIDDYTRALSYGPDGMSPIGAARGTSQAGEDADQRPFRRSSIPFIEEHRSWTLGS